MAKITIGEPPHPWGPTISTPTPIDAVHNSRLMHALPLGIETVGSNLLPIRAAHRQTSDALVHISSDRSIFLPTRRVALGQIGAEVSISPNSVFRALADLRGFLAQSRAHPMFGSRLCRLGRGGRASVSPTGSWASRCCCSSYSFSRQPPSRGGAPRPRLKSLVRANAADRGFACPIGLTPVVAEMSRPTYSDSWTTCPTDRGSGSGRAAGIS